MCITSSSSNQRCPPGPYPSLSSDQGTQMEPKRTDEGCICPRQRGVVKEQATGGYKLVVQGKSSTLMEVTQWLTDWTQENSSLLCSMQGGWEALLFYSLNTSCTTLTFHISSHAEVWSLSRLLCIYLDFFFFLSTLHVDLSAFYCETTAGSMIYLGIFMADLLYKIHCTGWMRDFPIDNLQYILYGHMICLNCRLYQENEPHPVTTRVFLSLLLAFMLKFKHS